MIDLETDDLGEDKSFSEVYDSVMAEATSFLGKSLELENTMLEHYRVPTVTVDGKR